MVPVMAKGHALSGIAIGLGTAPLVGDGIQGTTLAWVGTVAGCALLPDLDVAGSRAGRMWGPVTGGVHATILGKRRTLIPGMADVVGIIAGGHRRGSHSVLGLLVLLAVTSLAAWSTWVSAAVVALLVGLALTVVGALIPGRQFIEWWPGNLGLSIAGGWIVVHTDVQLPLWVAVAMALGAAVHIAGDMITVQGCPLGWPTQPRRVYLLPAPLRIEVNGLAERWLITPVLGVAAVAMALHAAGLDLGDLLQAIRDSYY